MNKPVTIEQSVVYDKVYVDGAWVVPQGSELTELVFPATGQISGSAVRCNAVDVDNAVAAAKTAFTSFSKTSKKEKIRLLESFQEECLKRQEQIEKAVTLDIGAPASIANAMHASIGISVIKGVIDGLEQMDFEKMKSGTMIVREPAGVAALICPWNGPVVMFCGKVASALAAGCTIVYKPAELATHTAMVLAEALIAVELPRGVFNMVTGKGSVVGEELSNHPGVDYISFTGSNAVGARITEPPRLDSNSAASPPLLSCLTQICFRPHRRQ